jgi:transposase
MDNTILVACDLHDKNMRIHNAVGRGPVKKQTVENDVNGRKALIAQLRQQAAQLGGARIVFAYEASGAGFGFYDELTAAGIEGHVLAPSNIARSPQHRRNKFDDRDTARILELLRGHVLGGNPLPDVWIPDLQTRDDREIVRARLDAQAKCSKLKAQIRALCKRNSVVRPQAAGKGWTTAYYAWLKLLAECAEPLGLGARCALSSLLRQLEHQQHEVKMLDAEIEKLSKAERYAAAVLELNTVLKSKGLLIAMAFLTEMGDLTRFKNRRQVGAYLGVVPSANESGETDDRKGHITHQGPARVRYVLCQAVWNLVKHDTQEKIIYERIVKKNPKHKKIAVVASMRRLAVRLWHAGLRVKKTAQNKIAEVVGRNKDAFKAQWNGSTKKKAHAQAKACALPSSRRVTRQCCPARA